MTGDFIIDYDILSRIAKTSNFLGSQADEYANCLYSRVANAISNITGPSSAYLEEAHNSVTEKIELLQKKAADFYCFSSQISSLAETASQVDNEVERLYADSQENFLQHHKSLSINGWKIALLSLLIKSKNNLPFLELLSDILNVEYTTQETGKKSLQNWYLSETKKRVSTTIADQEGLFIGTGLLVGNLSSSLLLSIIGNSIGTNKRLNKRYDFIENVKKGFQDFVGFMKSDEGKEFIEKAKEIAYEKELKVEIDKLMSNIEGGECIYNWVYLKEIMSSNEDITEVNVQAVITMYKSFTEAEDIEMFLNCSCIYNLVESEGYFNIYKLSPLFIALANTYGKKIIYPQTEDKIINQCIDSEEYKDQKRQMSKAAILENMRDYGDFISITGPNFDLTKQYIPQIINITVESETDNYDYTISNQNSNGFLPNIQVLGLRNGLELISETDKVASSILSEYIYDDATKDKVNYITSIIKGKVFGKIIPNPISIILGGSEVVWETWEKQSQNRVLINTLNLNDFSKKAEAACIMAVISTNDTNFAVNYSYCDEKELELRLEYFNNNITIYLEQLQKDLLLNEAQIKSLNLEEDIEVDDILNGFNRNDEDSLKLTVYMEWYFKHVDETARYVESNSNLK